MQRDINHALEKTNRQIRSQRLKMQENGSP